jgi:hypothetical protein
MVLISTLEPEKDLSKLMKRILSYKLFEEQETPELTQEQIDWLNFCTYPEGTNKRDWKLNPETGLVDIDGNFNCSGQSLIDFKGIMFGTVSKYFNCANNQLTSLEGAPKDVGGYFDCKINNLTSLNGAPERVGGNFDCERNQLTSLEGAPAIVGGYFYCGNNQLVNLKGAPEKVGGYFYASDNPVHYSTLLNIYDIMSDGYSYPEALSQYWDEMLDSDKDLMYADNPDLSDDEKRGYELKIRSSKRIY